MTFDTKRMSGAPDAVAPAGSEVHVLCRVERGSMARSTPPPKAVSRAVAHRTVEEIWCFVSGRGRMWRRLGDRDETVEVGSGASVTIPAGTRFQFRCDGDEPPSATGATMPPRPGDDQACGVDAPWQATV